MIKSVPPVGSIYLSLGGGVTIVFRTMSLGRGGGLIGDVHIMVHVVRF